MYAKHPPQSTPNRGYSYVGQESISSISGFDKGISGTKSVRDVKVSSIPFHGPHLGAVSTNPSLQQETYDLGSKDDTSAPNQWILESSLPGFRTFMESFYSTAFRLEMQLLAALAMALGISPTTLINMHSKAQNEFRLLHYPAVHASELRDGSATRIAEHTDFGTITMLFQDSTGGLQVEDQENLGTFHDVSSASQNEIILNIGDSLQRLTNDTFRAACHRVTYPPTIRADDEEIIPERFSIAYFAKVDRDAILYPFEEFITEDRPAKYPGMTSGEFNNLRIAKLFG